MIAKSKHRFALWRRNGVLLFLVLNWFLLDRKIGAIGEVPFLVNFISCYFRRCWLLSKAALDELFSRSQRSIDSYIDLHCRLVKFEH